MRIQNYFGLIAETTPAVTLRKTGAKNWMLDLTPPRISGINLLLKPLYVCYAYQRIQSGGENNKTAFLLPPISQWSEIVSINKSSILTVVYLRFQDIGLQVLFELCLNVFIDVKIRMIFQKLFASIVHHVKFRFIAFIVV